MKLATTTGDFALFTPSHAERLRHVYDAGFRYVDLSMYDDFGGDSPFFAPDWRDYTQQENLPKILALRLYRRIRRAAILCAMMNRGRYFWMPPSVRSRYAAYWAFPTRWFMPA